MSNSRAFGFLTCMHAGGGRSVEICLGYPRRAGATGERLGAAATLILWLTTVPPICWYRWRWFSHCCAFVHSRHQSACCCCHPQWLLLLTGALLSSLLQILASFEPLVEIGCGKGYWSRLLRDRGVDIVAYDISLCPSAQRWTALRHGGPEVLV